MFDHENLGQVLAGFPSTIVIYNDPCIVVLNQICQIHSEIYQSKHLRFSDSHLQMCLLILILVNYSYLFHCPVPQVVWKPGFLAIFATFFGEVSGEDQRTLWLRHARGTWQKELHLMSQLHVSCHPIRYIQNRMRALRILKDTRKGFLLIELWNMVKPSISKCLNVRRCLDLKVLESMMPLMAGSFESNARVRWLRSSFSISVQRPVWQLFRPFNLCSDLAAF